MQQGSGLLRLVVSPEEFEIIGAVSYGTDRVLSKDMALFLSSLNTILLDLKLILDSFWIALQLITVAMVTLHLVKIHDVHFSETITHCEGFYLADVFS